MMTKKPDRVKPNPKTRAKARRAFRLAAEAAVKNQAVQVFDAKGRPRNTRHVVKNPT
jgi:hypothetical protein